MSSARVLGVCALTAALAAQAVAAVPAAQAAAPRCDGLVATIVGSAGDDHIVGTPRADVIVGLAGRDRIDGRGGDDRICGGDSDDLIRGGSGHDRLFGQGNRTWADRGGVRVFGDVLDGGPGDDLVDVGPATPYGDYVFGERVEFLSLPGPVVVDLAGGTATGHGDDVIRPARRMYVRTGAGDDTVLGTRWGEKVDAGPGNDTVSLRGGNDTFVERRTSLPDDDVVDTGSGVDMVRARSGADQISTGRAPDDVRLLGQGPVTLHTGKGSDVVFARAGDRPGASYDLGPGSEDYFSLEPWRLGVPGGWVPVRVDVPAGLLTVTTDAGPVGAGISGVERYVFGDGWALRFLGGEGPDAVESLGSGPLHAVTGGGDDNVWGTDHADHIDGGDGHDVAHAGKGDDTCVDVEERDSC